MEKITHSFKYGSQDVTLETGRIARQASSVLITIGETVVLVTVVAGRVIEGANFFPLTVHYQEKTYAAGKIPGGFLKREGRPSEFETLTSRLLDRPIRPLFPKGFNCEVQVVATLLSVDHETAEPDVAALIGASAALSISGLPFQGPIAAARVGYRDGNYLLNPAGSDIESSDLDLVVAGTKQAVLMVESQAKMLPEDVMLGAVVYGHEQMQVAIDAIDAFTKKVVGDDGGAGEWVAAPVDEALQARVAELAKARLEAAYQIPEKLTRQDEIAIIREETMAALEEASPEAVEGDGAKNLFSALEKSIVRSRVIKGEKRIDGRDSKTVRTITIEPGILPRAHGSALFTRGETQAIVAATLGTTKDSQIIDALRGESRDRFMLHYNFPPYCVGETGMMGSPKRREIGHGRLARRGIEAVLPSEEEFPYVLRVVSEITESNGSSSMASVCGTSLALMDAGVPTKAPVAGIAMGLVKEGDDYVVLTDILGDEDHLGDMDFKVAGTSEGLTALQMDIKIDGITKEIMQVALNQAKDGRLHILNLMNDALGRPRDEMSRYAPRFYTINVAKDKIRDVIGKGGETIRGLTEQTGCTIEIDDDGLVKIASADETSAQEALARIKEITADVEVDQIYEGKVVKIVDFGAFVEVLPGKQGLLHISQIADRRIENVTDELSEGQEIKVKVIEIDRQGRVRLSMKVLLQQPAE